MTDPSCLRAYLETDTPVRLGEAITAKLAQRTQIPIGHIELLLTEGCNHRCDYCFVKGKRESRTMSHTVACRALDFVLGQGRRLSQCNIMFFGGEPLLEFSLIRSLVPYARERAASLGLADKLSFSVTTNGTLLTEEMALFWQRERTNYLLSLDGDKHTHDSHRKTVTGESSYDLVMERFAMMKRYQPWQGTRMTVHPEFADRLRGNVERLARIGINQFIIGPATGVFWSDSDLLEYEHSLLDALKWVHQMKLRGWPLRLTLLEKDLAPGSGKHRGEWGCGAGLAAGGGPAGDGGA